MVANSPRYQSITNPALDIGNLPALDLLKKQKNTQISEEDTMSLTSNNKPQSKKKNQTFFDVFNPFSEKRKLIKAWNERNIKNAEVYLHAIDIEDKVIIFQQNIFIKHTVDLETTLRKQGFKALQGFPDEKLFEKFSSILWNKQFNIAIFLVNPKLDDIVKTSYEIATKHIEDSQTSLTVFLSTIEILMAKQEAHVYNN